MVEPEQVAEARRALGRRLAELRQAAGLSQQQLAPLARYTRSTIGNVETGRQHVPREFWQRCDEVLQAAGLLAAGYHAMTQMLWQHRRDSARAAAEAAHARNDRPDFGDFTVESHKFVPAYVGADAVARLAARSEFLLRPDDWLAGCSASLADRPDPTMLHVLPFGVGVFHIRERRNFSTITELAAWRWRSYQEVLAETTEMLTEQLGVAAASEYVLSLYWLTDSDWTGRDTDTAMRLLSVPSVLVNREPGDDILVNAEATERSLFSTGVTHPDLVAFGVPGIALGYASWTGVSYHPNDPARALATQELVAFELAVQSLWCYCQHILTEVEEGRDPVTTPDAGWRFLRAATSRLTAPARRKPPSTGSCAKPSSPPAGYRNASRPRRKYSGSQPPPRDRITEVKINSAALVVVDMQNGFVNERSAHVIPDVAALVEAWERAGGTTLFTRYHNHPGSMFERLMGWTAVTGPPETEIVTQLADHAARAAAVVDKPGYTLFSDEGAAIVRTRGWTDLVFCGIATESCVLKSAVDAFERGYTPWVVEDASASHAGDAAHQAGLLVAGRFIGTGQIVDAATLLAKVEAGTP